MINLLLSAFVLFVAACGDNRKPYLETNPPVFPVTVPPKTEPPKEVWKPAAEDIAGRWEKPCTAQFVNGASRYVREEIAFDEDVVTHTRFVHYTATCDRTTLLSTIPVELAFEDGWDAASPTLNTAAVTGWSGIFRDEDKPSGRLDYTDYKVFVHLVEETGTKVMYIKWTVAGTKVFDATADRYTYIGAVPK